jgi:hypothetical protein
MNLELPSSIPGAGFVNSIERRVARLGTVEKVVLGAAVVLGIEHLIAPRGMSMATKLYHKATGAFPSLPPVIPPPGVVAPALPAAVAKGAFAGANQMAGWNRGMSNYGQWSDYPQWHGHAGPWHSAHQYGVPGGLPDYSWE